MQQKRKLKKKNQYSISEINCPEIYSPPVTS